MADTETKTAPATKKPAAHRPFTVAAGCSFFYTAPNGETKKGRDGDKVMLSARQAKQFNNANLLRPFIDGDDEDAQEGDDE